MSNAVTARVNGDDYQGMVFWKYANDMLRENSNIEFIVYEDTEMKSFDDIVITYKNKVKFGDHDISKDYIQVKFHMRQTDFFTVENLLNPNFINGKENSLMDNIVSGYRKLGSSFKERRFIIYSVWDIRQEDELYGLIQNTDHSFAVDKIFDGTTSRSKMGKIRQKFYDKLKVTEQELKEILSQTCIYSGQEDISQMKELINRELDYNGLRAWPETKVTNPYINMIQGWMKRGIKRFDKAFLMAECKNEGLTVSKNHTSVIAIKSFQLLGESHEDHIESCLNLAEYFEDRFLKEGCSWEEIYHKIVNYVSKNLTKEIEYQVMLATHYTVAFLTGRILNSKSGIKTTAIQNTLHGACVWNIDQGDEMHYPGLQIKKKIIDENNFDSAIAVGITNDIVQEVEAYLEEENILIGHMYDCKMDESGNHVIANGNHAWQITEQLNNLIGKRSLKEKRSKLHIFYSGPATIMYYLGKLSLSYGSIQFYEYDFLKRRTATYYPSCKLPMEEES